MKAVTLIVELPFRVLFRKRLEVSCERCLPGLRVLGNDIGFLLIFKYRACIKNKFQKELYL